MRSLDASHPGLHPDLEENRCHLCQQKEDQQLATVNVLPRFSHHRPGRSDADSRSDMSLLALQADARRSKTHYGFDWEWGTPKLHGFSDNHRYRIFFNGYLMVYRYTPFSDQKFASFWDPFWFLSSVRRALAANDAPDIDPVLSSYNSSAAATVIHQ